MFVGPAGLSLLKKDQFLHFGTTNQAHHHQKIPTMQISTEKTSTTQKACQNFLNEHLQNASEWKLKAYFWLV